MSTGKTAAVVGITAIVVGVSALLLRRKSKCTGEE